MAYPQTPILTAFITALSTPPLVTDSITYDVFTTVQRGENQYVLVSQPTLTSGSGSTDCEAWDATLLLSVFTKYELNAAINFDQTLAIGTEMAERLVKQRLPLDGFDMSPIELALAETRQTANEGAIYVQHTLRLRFEVYDGESAVVPIGKSLNDYTPAELLGYPRLSELGPLNCPAPIVCPPVKVIDDFTVAEVLGYSHLDQLGALNCPVPTLVKTINDFTVAEVLAYDHLDQLGALNCPVSPLELEYYHIPFTSVSGDTLDFTLGDSFYPPTVHEAHYDPADGSFLVAAQLNGVNLTSGPPIGEPGDVLTLTRMAGNGTVTLVYNPNLA